MGVIICDSPSGPFSVTIIPKCGSTTIRTMLAHVAKPGQYRILDNGTVEKLGNWKLASLFKGECGQRSWAVLRNPWRRLLSRWREKGKPTWPEYVDAIAEQSVAAKHPMARSQAMILGANTHQRPLRIVTIEKMPEWVPEMERLEGIKLAPTHARSHGDYDWRAIYREYPETRDIVRNVFAADWELGIEWDDPCQT